MWMKLLALNKNLPELRQAAIAENIAAKMQYQKYSRQNE